jgi:hypothetical protein
MLTGRDNRSMQLIVPYATAMADDAGRVAAGLERPALAAYIARCAEPRRDDGEAESLSTPHERAVARVHGWHGADGCLPWAALAAKQAGVDPGDFAWGLLQPVHWRVGSDEVALVDPAALELNDDESRALFTTAQPLFEDAGYSFVWLDASRWLVSHNSLRSLATASIDRAIGRDVQRWLPRHAKAWSRLHSELQMAWYRDPVNDVREARGAWAVNALWLSGCGVFQGPAPDPVSIDDRLRAPALAGDWAAWSQAWQALDKEAIAPLLAADGMLTLCGESASVSLTPSSAWWPRVRASLRKPAVAALMESL